MNPSPQQWHVPFNCPACSKASRVTPSMMDSVLRCPHCGIRLVIGKSGIQEAPRGLLGLLAKAAARARDESARHGGSVKRRRDGPQALRGEPRHRRFRIAALVFSLGVTGAALVAVRSPGPFSYTNVLSGDVDTRQLTSGAEAFQRAFLADDLETARSFVLPSDAPVLSQWWLPRRAALRASFGGRFEGRVTDIEITERNRDQAVVRVLFTIQARQQQAFQDWQRTTAGWKLELTGNNSRAARGPSRSKL